MKYLNKKLFERISLGQDYARAIAFSVMMKQQNLVSSTVTKCTINKLHKMTGLHAKSIEKYLLRLSEMKLIEERPNGDIVFKSLSSKSESRNMPPLDFEQFHTFNDIEMGLYTVVIMEIIRRKEYVKKMTDIRFNPKKDDNFKKACKYCRKHHITREYKENGLSYEGIATRLNISKSKAEKVIKFAIKHKLLKKHNRQIQLPIWGIGKKVSNKEAFKATIGCTFVTKHNVYKVLANTYTIIDHESPTYKVNMTITQDNLPKWQTAENLLYERMEKKNNDLRKQDKKVEITVPSGQEKGITTIGNSENLAKNINSSYNNDISNEINEYNIIHIHESGIPPTTVYKPW